MKHIKRNILWILIILLIVFAGAAAYFYMKANKSPSDEANAQAKSLAQEVGKIMLLPGDEVPTVATVSDPAALEKQAFFADAKVGYKVLIYTNAKKAILYDPATKKIVNVAPLNIDGNGQGTVAPKTVTAPAGTSSDE